MGVNDKAEEEIYLTAGQTIVLIAEVRSNLLETILGKEDLMPLNTNEIIPKLRDIKKRDMKDKQIQE